MQRKREQWVENISYWLTVRSPQNAPCSKQRPPLSVNKRNGADRVWNTHTSNQGHFPGNTHIELFKRGWEVTPT